jgi:hypothetical protein
MMQSGSDTLLPAGSPIREGDHLIAFPDYATMQAVTVRFSTPVLDIALESERPALLERARRALDRRRPACGMRRAYLF